MSVYFLNAEFNYPKTIVDEVVLFVARYVDEVTKDLSVEGPFDVTIYPNYKWTEGVGGVDGHAMSGGVLQIRIDLRDSVLKIKDLLGAPLQAVVYHECNHIARWQGPGYGWSLLEATVSEGVATVYEKMKTEPHEMSHADYSNIEELLQIYRLRNKDEDLSYNHNTWFLGFDPKYPKFLGYKVGTYIVEKVLELNPELSLIQITRLEVDEIIKLSKVEL